VRAPTTATAGLITHDALVWTNALRLTDELLRFQRLTSTTDAPQYCGPPYRISRATSKGRRPARTSRHHRFEHAADQASSAQDLPAAQANGPAEPGRLSDSEQADAPQMNARPVVGKIMPAPDKAARRRRALHCARHWASVWLPAESMAAAQALPTARLAGDLQLLAGDRSLARAANVIRFGSLPVEAATRKPARRQAERLDRATPSVAPVHKHTPWPGCTPNRFQ